MVAPAVLCGADGIPLATPPAPLAPPARAGVQRTQCGASVGDDDNASYSSPVWDCNIVPIGCITPLWGTRSDAVCTSLRAIVKQSPRRVGIASSQRTLIFIFYPDFALHHLLLLLLPAWLRSVDVKMT
jgi:hypothetical protein